MISGLFLSGIIVWLAGALACLALWRKPAAARRLACGAGLAGSLLDLAGSSAALFSSRPAAIGMRKLHRPAHTTATCIGASFVPVAQFIPSTCSLARIGPNA